MDPIVRGTRRVVLLVVSILLVALAGCDRESGGHAAPGPATPATTPPLPALPAPTSLQPPVEHRDPRLEQALAEGYEALVARVADTSATFEQRTIAAAALERLGDPRAVAALAAALSGLGERFQEQFEPGFEEQAEPVTVEWSEEYLLEDAIAGALIALGEPSVSPVLALAGDPVHLDAILERILTGIGRPAVPALLAVLPEEESLAWRLAVSTLGAIGDPRAVAPLVALLGQDWDVDAVEAALAGFGQAAVPELISTLGAGGEAAAPRAAGLLARSRDPRAVEPLLAALEADDAALVVAALRALAQFGDRRAVEPAIALLDSDEGEVMRFAAEVIEAMPDQRAVAPLVTGLPDLVYERDARTDWSGVFVEIDTTDERYVAEPLNAGVEALVAIGPPAVEPLLTALANEGAAELQIAAADALGRLGERRAGEALIAALASPEETLRAAAARNLARLRPDGWIEALQRAFEPEAARVLAGEASSGAFGAVLLALGTSGEPRADALLADFATKLKGEDAASERNLVALALAANPGPRARAVLDEAFLNRDLATIAGAHSYFLRARREGSVELFTQALSEWDDVTLALALLNSGDTELERVARAWAEATDRVIMETPLRDDDGF